MRVYFCFLLLACVHPCVTQMPVDHLKQLRKRAKKAIAKRAAKRVAAYKQRLIQRLPSQIELWRSRENRLLSVITAVHGISISALLVRECPDPPVEADPDTDDEGKKEDDNSDDHGVLNQSEKVLNGDVKRDPTTRPWTSSDAGVACLLCVACLFCVAFLLTTHYCATIVSAAALNISDKQRTRLQQQAMSMAQYCGLMSDRASTMLKFINVECPDNRGDVLTLFREKYPQYGLRSITLSVTKKMRKLFVCPACLFANQHTLTLTRY